MDGRYIAPLVDLNVRHVYGGDVVRDDGDDDARDA
jgi:hypothetical protein